MGTAVNTFQYYTSPIQTPPCKFLRLGGCIHFNTTLVRFKRSWSGSRPLSILLFQYYTSPIQTLRRCLVATSITYFNTTLVRFKRSVAVLVRTSSLNFNTTLVRFKQKRQGLHDRGGNHFNTTLVRFKLGPHVAVRPA